MYMDCRSKGAKGASSLNISTYLIILNNYLIFLIIITFFGLKLSGTIMNSVLAPSVLKCCAVYVFKGFKNLANCHKLKSFLFVCLFY